MSGLKQRRNDPVLIAFIKRHPMLYGISIGAITGGLVSWQINAPTPHWMRFNNIRASYEVGDEVIYISGTFTVVRECAEDGLVIWRSDAISLDDGRVFQYVPAPRPPNATAGTHYYGDAMQLNQTIERGNWIVQLLAYCSSETPSTVVSRSIKVTLAKQGP